MDRPGASLAATAESPSAQATSLSRDQRGLADRPRSRSTPATARSVKKVFAAATWLWLSRAQGAAGSCAECKERRDEIEHDADCFWAAGGRRGRRPADRP